MAEIPTGATSTSKNVMQISRIHNTREASASRNESFNTAKYGLITTVRLNPEKENLRPVV